jgi:hypothetical protein
MIQSTLGVITNARADHLDQMGPTVWHVAEALANTIPKHATVFTAERALLPVFERRAAMNGSALVVLDPETVSDAEIAKFPYIEHKENVALALAVCAHLGIERAAALNAFAANDRDSTLMIAKRLGLTNRPEHPVFWIVNNRGDRLQRAEQFGEMIAGDIEAQHVFLVGDFTKATHDIAVRLGVPPHRLSDLGRVGADELFEAIVARIDRSGTILGVGNIGGLGREIATFFKNRSMEWSNKPSASGSF